MESPLNTQRQKHNKNNCTIAQAVPFNRMKSSIKKKKKALVEGEINAFRHTVSMPASLPGTLRSKDYSSQGYH